MKKKIFLITVFLLIQLALAMAGQQDWLAVAVNGVFVGLVWAFFSADSQKDGRVQLSVSPPSPNAAENSDVAIVAQQMVQVSPAEITEGMTDGFDVQLQLLQGALRLNSAVLVGPGTVGKSLLVKASCSRQDISEEPFAAETGVFGIFAQGRNTISGHPRSPHFKGLPYYNENGQVGGFYGVALECQDGQKKYYLCVDRDDTEPWQEEEKALVRETAAKIATDLFFVEQFALMDRDRQATSQVCLAMQELNTALGQKTAFDAVERAIRDLTGAEFIALTLVQDDFHAIVRASGSGASAMEGEQIRRSEAGLIEQVVTLRHEMPHKFCYQGPAPVFSQQERLRGFNSLLILPLMQDHDQVIGTLVMAGKRSGLFSEERLNILKVLGSQIATKIDLARAHEQINELATTDSLTGLANRRSMQNGFDLMLQRAKRTTTPLAVILCDIDFFKKINDTYGHPFGDEVLRGISTILRDSMRGVDLACRYGGEEFLLLLENSDMDGGWKLAERIRQQVGQTTFVCEGKPVSVTMSFGVSTSPGHGKEPAGLIECADQALYQAKEEGRDRTCTAA